MSANSSSVVVALLCLAPLAAADVLYVSNRGDGTIRRISPDGNIATFASGFGDPEGLAFDRSGNLYVADGSQNSVTRITPAGVVSTYATGLESAAGIAFDTHGNPYVAEVNRETIAKISPTGIVSTIATPQMSAFGLAFGPADNLYADSGDGNVVVKFSPDGPRTPIAKGFSVFHTRGAAFGPSGNLFVSVTGGPYMNSINRVTPAGTVDTLVRNLNGPYGIAFDSRGVLFVAESGSNTISSIASDGAVIPFVGGLNEPTFLVAQPVPEPGVLCLLALGSIGLVIRRARPSLVNLPRYFDDCVLNIEGFPTRTRTRRPRRSTRRCSHPRWRTARSVVSPIPYSGSRIRRLWSLTHSAEEISRLRPLEALTHALKPSNVPLESRKTKGGLLAELADAMDSKSIARKGVSVRLR